MVENEKCSKRTDHIVIRYHATKQSKENRIIELRYYKTRHMIADCVTKPIAKPELLWHRKSMNFLPYPSGLVKVGC